MILYGAGFSIRFLFPSPCPYRAIRTLIVPSHKKVVCSWTFACGYTSGSWPLFRTSQYVSVLSSFGLTQLLHTLWIISAISVERTIGLIPELHGGDTSGVKMFVVSTIWTENGLMLENLYLVYQWRCQKWWHPGRKPVGATKIGVSNKKVFTKWCHPKYRLTLGNYWSICCV